MQEFIKELEKDGIISNENWLSISYQHNKKTRYRHLLFGHSAVMNIIDNLQEVTIFKDGIPIKEKIVPHDNQFFQSKFQEFLHYLGKEPRMFFTEVYGDNTPKYLEMLVYNYYDSKGEIFDNLEDERNWNSLFDKIKLEFSKYKTFRGYLIYMDRYFEKHPEMEREIPKPKVQLSFSECDYEDYGNETEEFLTEEEYNNATPEGDDWYNGPKRLR